MTSLLPGSSHTGSLWRALAAEPSLAVQVLELLLQKMSRDVPFKESRAFLLSSSPSRVATLLPLAVSAGRGAHTPRPFSLPGTPRVAWAPPRGHLVPPGPAAQLVKVHRCRAEEAGPLHPMEKHTRLAASSAAVSVPPSG